MKARWIGEGIESYEALTQPGDIGIGAENYHGNLMVCCPCCGQLHVVTIHEGQGPLCWAWDQSTLTLSPSVRVGPSYRGVVCHWNITAGEFIIHGDSTQRTPTA